MPDNCCGHCGGRNQRPVAVEEARHAGENTISAEAQEHSANQAPGETVRQITRENSGRPPTLLARKSRGPQFPSIAKVASKRSKEGPLRAPAGGPSVARCLAQQN